MLRWDVERHRLAGAVHPNGRPRMDTDSTTVVQYTSAERLVQVSVTSMTPKTWLLAK
jgi:hypothetical protein